MDFKGSHFEKEIILWGVRWYVAYPISYRQLEEMMGERGVAVDGSFHTQSVGYQIRPRGGETVPSSAADSVAYTTEPKP